MFSINWFKEVKRVSANEVVEDGICISWMQLTDLEDGKNALSNQLPVRQQRAVLEEGFIAFTSDQRKAAQSMAAEKRDRSNITIRYSKILFS